MVKRNDDKTPDRAPGTSDGGDGQALPRTLVGVLAAGVFLLLAYNVIYDSLSDAYQGYPTTLVLGGLFGGCIGVRRFLGGGGGSQ